MNIRARLRARNLVVPLWTLFAAAFALALVVAPGSALAREYSISKVYIDATLDDDGALTVVESRTFDFDGSFNGVYWDIPKGMNPGNGREVEISVLSAGEGGGFGMQEFSEGYSGQNGTYEVDDRGDVLRLKVYSSHEDERATFTIAYRATGIATRWDDTGELYWKFVSDGWDVESQNVICNLHLPVPEGESVEPAANVRAWGHGPLDASVAFNGDDVVFTVPGVGTEEFAEMRVTFPREWIAGCEATSGSELETILGEEQTWADEANARRARARLLVWGIAGATGVLAVATVVYTVFVRRRYAQAVKPQFQDKYFRDVPTDDHPAVLGALVNGGKAEPKELTATLMRLTDQGVVRLDKVRRKVGSGWRQKEKDDFLLTKVKGMGAAPEGAAMGENATWAHAVDAAACTFVFGKVAKARNEVGSKLYLSSVERTAKKEPEAYSDAWNAWANVVEGRFIERFQDEAIERKGMVALAVLGVFDVILAIGSFALQVRVFESPLGIGIGLPALLLVVGIVAIVCAATMQELNREGIETSAKLEALRRWLKEFTHLSEAVPSDVVLWNRLLVMAVVLGVADEVIKQLEVACPQVIQDPYFAPCYGWCYGGYGIDGRPPAAAFTGNVASAHKASAAAIAASSSSSGDGGGGGFSGGGGGGFGGGGGGGAF